MADTMIEKLIELQKESVKNCVPGETCVNCRYIAQTDCMERLTADYMVANGVTVQQWIPVTERLPSKEEYNAKTDDGTEYYVRLLFAYKTDIVEYEIGYYDGYKWMTEMPIRIIKDVVAWMPFPNMPTPPKEE